MNNDLVTSAIFNEKNSQYFYLKFFCELKEELEFSYGALFYKSSGRYKNFYEKSFSKSFDSYAPKINQKEEGFYKLKIPVTMQGNSVGCFLLVREAPFLKSEKEKAKAMGKIWGDRLKDFEISKIFQNQLVILQNAIIEKNEATKKLKEQNEKLIETDKTRSEFLANVSHELRTPLNSIIGFSTALKDEMMGPLNEKQKNYANKILSSSIHLTGLINDILDMTKIEARAMKLNLIECSPEEIIKEVVNIIEPLAQEKEIEIKTNFKFKGSLTLDCAKFRQIIYNLAGNAIKFSHKNSKIIIQTNKKDNSAIFSIKDFGVGIEKKNHKKIFEKFVQLDNIYTKTSSSTGLGLTITNELVKMMNGKIHLKSSPNKGSEFILKFPL